MKSKLAFRTACAQYVHRFTMEHVPQWAKAPHYHNERKEWVYYAPQYRTDREWYENTLFPPHSGFDDSCYSSGQTWPLGQWLDAPFQKTKGSN